MLRRADVRVIWRGAGVGESPKLRIDGDKGIDAGFDLRLQLFIGDLADDPMPDIAPREGERRLKTSTKEDCQENEYPHRDCLEPLPHGSA